MFLGMKILNDAELIVMHNGIAFDHPALAKLDFHFDNKKIYDTLIVSRLVNPIREGGHSLRSWGEQLGFSKGEVESFDTYTPEMLEYCKRDVALNLKVYEHLVSMASPHANNLEHKVARVIQQQVNNGFGFDIKKAEQLASELYAETKDAEDKLKEVFPPIFIADKLFKPKADNKRLHYVGGCELTKIKLQQFNPASRQQIANRLISKYNWKPRKFTPSGMPEVSETILATLPFEEAKAMHRYLRVEKMLSMLVAWLKLQRKGRIYGEVNTLGARTGRMTHRNPNVAQADSDKRMRELFIPREGWKLVGIDADGIEARLLGHYLAKYDDGEFADRVINGDFHTYNQKLCELKERFNAKRLFYAFMYGAGDGKIGQIVHDDNPFKGSKVKKGKETRKKLSEGIKGLNTLVNKARQAAATKGFLLGLDKRKLFCPSPHTALNTLIQGSSALVMKQALVLFDEQVPQGNWNYCANVHDEVQIESQEDIAQSIAEEMVHAIVKTSDVLNLRCQLNGSYSIGNNWSETH